MSHRLTKQLSAKIKSLKAENRLLRRQLKMNNFPPTIETIIADGLFDGVSDETFQQLVKKMEVKLYENR